jgi:hypothetical protein
MVHEADGVLGVCRQEFEEVEVGVEADLHSTVLAVAGCLVSILFEPLWELFNPSRDTVIPGEKKNQLKSHWAVCRLNVTHMHGNPSAYF